MPKLGTIPNFGMSYSTNQLRFTPSTLRQYWYPRLSPNFALDRSNFQEHFEEVTRVFTVCLVRVTDDNPRTHHNPRQALVAAGFGINGKKKGGRVYCFEAVSYRNCTLTRGGRDNNAFRTPVYPG